MREWRRYADWPQRLSTFIAAHRDRAFAWGMCDCALFAADNVKGLTGEDFGQSFRGTYTTRLGAAKALAAHGTPTLTDVVSAALGASLERPLMAYRGDIVLMPNAGDPSLGVCVGSDVAMMREDQGLVFVPLSGAFRAWRV